MNGESESDAKVQEESSEGQKAVPTKFSLSGNYPNPFQRTTELRYAVPKNTHVDISVYDVLGRKVAQLVDDRQSAGYHRARWNAANVSSGTYLLRMNAGDFTAAETLVVVR